MNAGVLIWMHGKNLSEIVYFNTNSLKAILCPFHKMHNIQIGREISDIILTDDYLCYKEPEKALTKLPLF